MVSGLQNNALNPTESSDPVSLILVDTHVHFHAGHDPECLLDSASVNFGATARSLAEKASWEGVLVLTDDVGEPGFEAFLEYALLKPNDGSPGIGRWTFQNPDEDTTLHLRSDDDETLYLIAGRQIRTEDGLEILALGTRNQFSNHRSISTILRDVREAGALAVLPWGAGKWLGARRDNIRLVIDSCETCGLFLSDSGNRPVFWSKSSLFDLAADRGIRNLPGSDPLPLPGEHARVGTCGFALPGELDLARPSEDLKERLRNPTSDIQPFLRRERTLRFLRNQIAMQIKKRLR